MGNKILKNLKLGLAGIVAFSFLPIKNYGQTIDITRDSIEISIKSQNKDTIEQITWFSEEGKPLLPHYALFYLDKKENEYRLVDCYEKIMDKNYLSLSSKNCSQIEEFFNEFYKLYGSSSLNYPKKYHFMFPYEGISIRREIND